jgi:hypothetical protein
MYLLTQKKAVLQNVRASEVLADPGREWHQLMIDPLNDCHKVNRRATILA